MTPEQFAYWLQGFAEVSDRSPNVHEWKIIKDHLATVFKKITPTYPTGPGVLVPRDTQPYTRPWTEPPIVTCSVAAGAGTNWSFGAGDAVYSHFTNAATEANKKLNKDLK